MLYTCNLVIILQIYKFYCTLLLGQVLQSDDLVLLSSINNLIRYVFTKFNLPRMRICIVKVDLKVNNSEFKAFDRVLGGFDKAFDRVVTGYGF